MNVILFFPVLLLFLLSLLAEVFLGIWTYRDARARGLNAVLWTVVVLLAPSFIGLIVYLVAGRNQAAGLCPNCNAAVQANVKYCPGCGGAMAANGDGAPAPKPLPKAGKGFLIAFIVCVALMILGAVACAVAGLLAYNTNVRTGFPETSIAIGSLENHSSRRWTMSFYSLNGKKENDQLEYDGATPSAVHVKSSLGGGKLTLELTQGNVRQAVDLSSPQNTSNISLEEFQPGRIHMTIVAEDARDGNVEIWWD